MLSATTKIWYEKSDLLRRMSARFDLNGRLAPQAISQDLRERSGHAADLFHAEAGVAQQVPQRSEGEQPSVGAVENARLPVVELTEEQHQPLNEEGDIRRRQHQRLRRVLELRPQPLDERLGFLQVLDDVEQQQVVGLADVEGQLVVEVLNEDLDGRVFCSGSC